MICVKLDIFQGQGMHRKRHAVIKSVTFFYKNKTLSRDYLEAGVHVYVLMSYTFTKKNILLYVLGQSAKDSEVLLWFTHHYYNGYSDSRLIFLGFFTSGTISILLSPQFAFKVSLWYLARATWHDSPGLVSHIRFCMQGTGFTEERGIREERLENLGSAGSCAKGRQNMVLSAPAENPKPPIPATLPMQKKPHHTNQFSEDCILSIIIYICAFHFYRYKLSLFLTCI